MVGRAIALHARKIALGVIRMSDAKVNLVPGYSHLVVDDIIACPQPISDFDLKVAIRPRTRPRKDGNAATRFRVLQMLSQDIACCGASRDRRLSSATRSNASIAACHSWVSCSGLGSFVM
jgi:hypothetical protein